MMSSMCSMPMLSRIVSGPTPALACSSRRHLPVRGRGRMAGERLGIAHVDQPLDQAERVIEFLAGFEAALARRTSAANRRGRRDISVPARDTGCPGKPA